MSILSDIGSGLSKATSFLLKVFTKTNSVIGTIGRLSPATLAAMLAVFYDVMKTVTAVGAIGADVSSGALPAAFALSETTLTLVKQIGIDAKAAESIVVADLQSLGIISAATPSV